MAAGLSKAKGAAVVGCTGAGTRLRGLPLLAPCFGLGPSHGEGCSPTAEQLAAGVRAKLAGAKAAAAAAHGRLLDVTVSPLGCFEASPAVAELAASRAPAVPPAQAPGGRHGGVGQGSTIELHAAGEPNPWPVTTASVMSNPLFDSVEAGPKSGAGRRKERGQGPADQQGRPGQPAASAAGAPAGAKGSSAAAREAGTPDSVLDGGAVFGANPTGSRRRSGCSSNAPRGGGPPNACLLAAVQRGVAVANGLCSAAMLLNFSAPMVLTRLVMARPLLGVMRV